MSASYPITTSLRVIKELQYVKETTKGITPNSPSFTAIPVSEFVPVTDVRSVRYIKLGTATVSKTIKNTTNYHVSISYTPITIDQLFESMINLTGANNREDTYSFLLSQEHNDSGTLTEMYQIARGCAISTLTITVAERRLVSIKSRWLALSISDWSTSHGLTTPTFAPTLTDTPWSAIDTGQNPLVFVDLDDGETYDIRNLSVIINHNTTRTQVLDQFYTVRINPGPLEIDIDMDIVYKDTQISESVKTFSAQQLTMRLNNDALTFIASTLTFNDVFLERYDETVDAESTRAKVVSYSGRAASMLITQEYFGGNFIDDNFITDNFNLDP